MGSAIIVIRFSSKLGRFLTLCLVGLHLLAGSFATTIIQPNFSELATQADLVFRGRVTNLESRSDTSSTGRAIYTRITFEVTKVYKGQAGKSVTLEFLGGEANGARMEVSGMPTFLKGDEVVLFTDPDKTAACPVLGWNYGVFDVESQINGSEQPTISAYVNVPESPVPPVSASQTPSPEPSSSPNTAPPAPDPGLWSDGQPVLVSPASARAAKVTGAEAPAGGKRVTELPIKDFEERLNAVLAPLSALPSPSPSPSTGPPL